MCPDQRNNSLSTDGLTVARLVALLTAFQPGDRALGVSELARRSGIPKTSAHRLAGHLVEHGIFERAGTCVRLGLKIFEIGQLATHQRGLIDAARPHLADLREATRNTTHLAVLEGAEVVYLDVQRGTDAPTLPSRIGGRFPAHATAVGKAILAFSSEETVDDVIRAGLPRVSSRTITSPAILRQQLERVRAEGVAFDCEESGEGVTCVASPLINSTGNALAAISISGWIDRMRVSQLSTAVRTSALTVSRKIQ